MKCNNRILFISGKAVLGILLFLGCWLPAGFGQSLNTDGTLHTLLDSNKYREFVIPNSPDKPYLYLSAVGADGGKREFTVITTCTKQGGQGAHAAGWFKIGNDGLTPGGTLRFIIGQRGADQNAPDTEAAGGGGGTGVIYLPKGANPAIPQNWIILLVAGGGGGGASDGFCGGSHGQPGQAGPNGSNGDGPSHGAGGSDGGGGEGGAGGAGGGGWRLPGKSAGQETYGEFDFWNNLTMVKGGGFSGSGKMVYNDLGIIHDYWSGGFGGRRSAYDHAQAWGGFGFGGGGGGLGSGGGGGGYSGGGGGGLTGAGNGGGGGGGSYVNTGLTFPYAIVTLEQRSTTAHPADGTVQYQFFAASPVATRDLGFHYNKSTEASVLQTGDFSLRWQSDGNLVLYQAGVAKWASNTNTKGTDIYFQGDGNLVIRQNGNAIWASNTANDQHSGKGGLKLVLTKEGHLFIVDQDGKPIWTGR